MSDAQGAAIAADRFVDDLRSADRQIICEATALVRDWYRLPHERLAVTPGIPRVDQVLFERLPGDRIGAVLLDRQVTDLRNPRYDVRYFLSGSVSVADRRAHEHGLLTRYATEFADRTEGYELRTITSDYQVRSLSNILIWKAVATAA